jgi:hypothetical protein
MAISGAKKDGHTGRLFEISRRTGREAGSHTAN